RGSVRRKSTLLSGSVFRPGSSARPPQHEVHVLAACSHRSAATAGDLARFRVAHLIGEYCGPLQRGIHWALECEPQAAGDFSERTVRKTASPESPDAFISDASYPSRSVFRS